MPKLYMDHEVTNEDHWDDVYEAASAFVLIQTVNERPQLRFTLAATHTDIEDVVLPGMAVLYENPTGTAVFAGVVDEVEAQQVVDVKAVTEVGYSVICVDYSELAFRRLLTASLWDTDDPYSGSISVGDVLDDLFTDALTAEGLTEGTIDSDVHDTVVRRIDAVYRTCGDVLNELAEMTGATWWVDASKALQMRTVTGVGEWSKNMLTGGSFEAAALTGWSTWGTPDTSERSSTQKYTGSYALKHIENTSSNDGVYQNVTAVVGQTYTVSVWIWCAETQGVRLEVYDGANAHIDSAVDSETWRLAEVTVTAQATTIVVRLGGKGEAYFDAAQCERGSYRSDWEDGGLPKDMRNVRLRQGRDRYRNRQYVSSLVRGLEESADGALSSITTDYQLASAPVISHDDDTYGAAYYQSAATSADTYHDIYQCVGLGWDTASGPDLVQVVSNDAGDTSDVYLYGMYNDDTAGEEKLTLTGTTPVDSTVIYKAVCGVILEDHDGTVTVQWRATPTTITTFAEGVNSAGTANLSAVYTGVNCEHDGSSAAAMIGGFGGAGTKHYAAVFNEFAGTIPPAGYRWVFVDWIYFGACPASTGPMIRAKYPWVYALQSKTLTVNTAAGNIVAANDTITYKYTGERWTAQSATTAQEVTDRAANDGGSGYYDQALDVDESYTTTAADTLAEELIDVYCNDAGTSRFPRKTLTFDTWESSIGVGQYIDVTYAPLNLGAVDGNGCGVIASEERMLVTRIEAVKQSVESAGAYALLYRLTLVNTPAIGEWDGQLRAWLREGYRVQRQRTAV